MAETSDARKRREEREGRDHQSHPDPTVAALIDKARADERERVLRPIRDLRDEWYATDIAQPYATDHIGRLADDLHDAIAMTEVQP